MYFLHLLISIRTESDLIIMWLHTEPRTDAKFEKFPTSLYRRPPFKHKPHAMSSTDPNQSLYIKGLPEKIRVEGNHQSFKARGDLNHVSNLRSKKLTPSIYRNQSFSIYTVSHVWRHIRYCHNEEGQDARTSLCCFWWHSVGYSSLKEFEWIFILREEPCKLSCCHIVYLRTNRERKPCIVLSNYFVLTLVHYIKCYRLSNTQNQSRTQ